MQSIAANDNRSWVFWAEIHGFNQYDCWHHSRVGPGRGTEFTYDLFLPWHRAYLTSFDHIARDQNPAAILPWWDWTSTAAHARGLPASYTGPEVNGQPNPLASGPTPDMPDDPARRTRRFPGDPADLPSMTDARPELGLNLSINEILALSQFADFTSHLQNVHDYIHGWTGGADANGVGGDMGVVPTSAFRPRLLGPSRHHRSSVVFVAAQVGHQQRPAGLSRQDARSVPLHRPETFDFLGFTHCCGKALNGGFLLKRITIKKRLRAKLQKVKEELMRRRHQPIPEQGHWLASVVRGHRAYYAVPGNYRAIETFRSEVSRHWLRALRRRSQRDRLSWERMKRLEARWLPPARIVHPWPEQRFDVRTRGKSPVR